MQYSFPRSRYTGRSRIVAAADKEYAAAKSILSVCLGHQTIGEAFGSKAGEFVDSVSHGVATSIKIQKQSTGNKTVYLIIYLVKLKWDAIIHGIVSEKIFRMNWR